MKLTNNTTPQARNHQCDKCKSIKCHKDMYDENICYNCWDNAENHSETCICDTCSNKRLNEQHSLLSKEQDKRGKE